MDRNEFEHLRDLPGKSVSGPIVLKGKPGHAPELYATNVAIENDAGADLRMDVSFNPKTGKKTVNVRKEPEGPICRLDVDGPAHRPATGSHKHSLQRPDCPNKNLPMDVGDRPDLSGKSVQDVLDEMCRLGSIGGKPQLVIE
jgi:hypothetical protein